MGKSTPDPPAAPDPYKTASAQGTSNANVATAQAALNNADVYNPYGSSTFKVTGQQTITNPDGTTTSVPTYTNTQTLNTYEQKMLDQNEKMGITVNNIANNALSQVGETLTNPLQASQFGTIQTSAGATPTLATGYNSGTLQTGYDQGGAIQKNVPYSLAATTFAGSDPSTFNAARDAATNAALARLQPQMDRSNAALQSQLANQGITAGSSAYNDALLQQSQGQNDQRLGAVQTGDAEQQALYNQALQSAGYGLSATQANNAARLAAGTFANAAQAQQNGQNAAQADFYNTATGNQAQMNAAQAAFGNSAATQDYQNRLAGGAFTNQAIAQQLQQATQLQNQQINEISALRSGGQVSSPSFTPYQSAQLDQTPLSSDVYQTAGLQEDAYKAQLQAQAQNTAAMGSALGGITGGIGRKSDRRLKSEVARIAVARNGLPIYRYRLDGENGWHIGMMADEVALVHPDAVWTDSGDGWARVDYSRAVA